MFRMVVLRIMFVAITLLVICLKTAMAHRPQQNAIRNSRLHGLSQQLFSVLAKSAVKTAVD
jgi:K+-transporting ATPase A subunit